jgi:hypothetical protein
LTWPIRVTGWASVNGSSRDERGTPTNGVRPLAGRGPVRERSSLPDRRQGPQTPVELNAGVVRIPCVDQETDVFRWEEWDWRPLARLIAWLILAALWARSRDIVSLALFQRAFRELLLGWLLSFGLLTYVQAMIATAAFRLALAFDDAAYGLSERLVRLLMRRASFAATFVAAFGVELALVLGALRIVAGAMR